MNTSRFAWQAPRAIQRFFLQAAVQ